MDIVHSKELIELVVGILVTMQKQQQNVVLFVDLLGFGSLTEQHPLDVDFISRSDRLDVWFEQAFMAPNPLTHAFTQFHRALRWALQFAQMKHPFTAITFSDSAFIATANLFEAVAIGTDLMQSLLRNGVPMRAGIASGSFEAVRFRSDIAADGGDHAAHFLGTGVIRAHAAEGCGIKGCRLLLHPTAVKLLSDARHNPPKPTSDQVKYLDCSGEECQNQVRVLHEVDYWVLGPTDEKRTWRGFQQMWDAAPEAEHDHYCATAAAINRMRVSRGETSLGDFRRRTLPRRRLGAT